jgi:hypothetical protein
MVYKNRLKHILVAILLIVGFNSNAQQIVSLTDFRNSDSKVESVEFDRLVFDNLSTVYLVKEKLIVKGDSPVRIVTDMSSWDKLNQVNDSESIKVIVLRIHEETDLIQTIDLKLLSRFPSVKRVFISGDFSICNGLPKDCEIDKISGILNGSGSVEIIYDFQTIN